MNIKEKEELLCSKYNSINRLLAIHNVEIQDREDLLHEIFIKALRSLDQLRDPEKIDPWLWSITRNEVNRYWRGIMTKRDMIRSLDTEDSESWMTEIDDAHYSVLTEELDRLCDREELVQALHELNEKTLILFRLYYFEGYKLKEIAQITGENEGTVKSRHKRGLRKLRDTMLELREQGQEKEDESEETSAFPLGIEEDWW